MLQSHTTMHQAELQVQVLQEEQLLLHQADTEQTQLKN